MPVLAMTHLSKNAVEQPRFELPALDLNFGKITDGTDIPPPLPSPKSSLPPRTPPGPATKDISTDAGPGPKKDNGAGNAGTHADKKDGSLSPVVSPRQGTLRRMLSKRTLNKAAAEGPLSCSQSAPVLEGGNRPQSRGGFSFVGDRKLKRNSGWFRKFRNGDQAPERRSSFLLFGSSSNNLSIAKLTEPPPPMIPELRELNKDEGSLGHDIFRNIK